MKDHVIIVAGGVGSRMGTALPKQFLEVDGRPVILRTIDTFLDYNPGIHIVVALNPGAFDIWEKMVEQHSIPASLELVEGGKERFFSVRNALQAIDDEVGIIGVHDAVRPFASIECIENCYATARESGNAIPAIRLDQSLRKLEGDSTTAVDRDQYRLIQTPQCFEVRLLKDAYRQEFDTTFTDDASVVEKLGVKINLVEGNRENIKLTTQEDMVVAEAIARHRI